MVQLPPTHTYERIHICIRSAVVKGVHLPTTRAVKHAKLWPPLIIYPDAEVWTGVITSEPWLLSQGPGLDHAKIILCAFARVCVCKSDTQEKRKRKGAFGGRDPNIFWILRWANDRKRLHTQQKVSTAVAPDKSSVMVFICPAAVCTVWGRLLYHILLSLTLSNIIPRSLIWHKALFCGLILDACSYNQPLWEYMEFLCCHNKVLYWRARRRLKGIMKHVRVSEKDQIGGFESGMGDRREREYLSQNVMIINCTSKYTDSAVYISVKV